MFHTVSSPDQAICPQHCSPLCHIHSWLPCTCLRLSWKLWTLCMNIYSARDFLIRFLRQATVSVNWNSFLFLSFVARFGCHFWWLHNILGEADSTPVGWSVYVDGFAFNVWRRKQNLLNERFACSLDDKDWHGGSVLTTDSRLVDWYTRLPALDKC